METTPNILPLKNPAVIILVKSQTIEPVGFEMFVMHRLMPSALGITDTVAAIYN